MWKGPQPTIGGFESKRNKPRDKECGEEAGNGPQFTASKKDLNPVSTRNWILATERKEALLRPWF